MLFNSLDFIFFFLPITMTVFFLLGPVWRRGALAWLFLASVAFYAWWDIASTPILLVSIVFNFLVGGRIVRAGAAGLQARAKAWLVLGVAGDLAALAYFKYVNFLIANLIALTGWSLPPMAVELPIGISFFTFTQIAFLADAYQKKAKEYDPVQYGLFVTYFPHLVAGPILHHKEMMPQFALGRIFRPDAGLLAAGATLFCIGLAKKVLLADTLALTANAIFDGAGRGGDLGMLTAWEGALAYTLQLYFDFSGYSDMAIGLSLMIGVRLPTNFDSPYKATSIIDFWRRWHMTLSRFLRDYLYIPLGGNRHGRFRQYANLVLTMLLGGLWHGASWTFILWGGLHGLFLLVNHGWRAIWARAGIGGVPARVAAVAGHALTFLCVVVAWVPFRSADIGSAWSFIGAMAGANGVASAEQIAGWIQRFAVGIPGVFVGECAWGAIPVGLAIAWFAPNSQSLLAAAGPTCDGAARASGGLWRRLAWTPGPAWGGAAGLLFAVAVTGIILAEKNVEFLYFNF